MSILDWLKSAALLSVIIFLGFGSYFVYVTTRSEEQIAKQASAILTHADSSLFGIDQTVVQVGNSFTNAALSVDQAQQAVSQVTTQLSGIAIGLQKTVALVNAPCVPGPCGLVGDADKTLNTSRLAIGQVEIAANSFDQNETRFYQQEDQLFTDSDGAVKNFNTILSSPELTGSIQNINKVTFNLGQTTSDFQTKFHDLLFPPPCVGFKCWVKKSYETVKVGSELLEPAYYGWSIASGLHP
jgi:hypothetical protein